MSIYAIAILYLFVVVMITVMLPVITAAFTMIAAVLKTGFLVAMYTAVVMAVAWLVVTITTRTRHAF